MDLNLRWIKACHGQRLQARLADAVLPALMAGVITLNAGLATIDAVFPLHARADDVRCRSLMMHGQLFRAA